MILALLTLPLPAAGMRRRIPPGDETSTDAAFAAFLAKLRRAAAGRDLKALRQLSAEDLPIEPEDLPELVKIIDMGAARFDKGFSLPYVHGKFPEDLDPYEHAIVVDPKAVLRSKPSASAAVAAPLDHDIVKVPEWKPNQSWQWVHRLDGVKGYVADAQLRTLGDHHAYCEKRKGVWRLIAFDQGD